MKDVIEFMTRNWKVITFFVTIIAAASIVPYRLNALEKNDRIQDTRIYEQQEQTTALYNWIKQRQTEEQMEKKLQEEIDRRQEEFDKRQEDSAPPGFYWDNTTQNYRKAM